MKGPTGLMMPRRAAEDAWKIHNQAAEDDRLERKSLSTIRLRERERGTNIRDDDAAREQAAKVKDEKRDCVKAKRNAVAGKAREFGRRLRNDLPLLGTLVTVSASLVVTLTGQLMFYEVLPWPPALFWLPIPMALLVESGSWTYGLQARHLAEKDQPYGGKVRMMWLLALGAAAMNAYHGATAFPGRPEMGIVLGGGSILGPLTWHGYLQLTKRQHQKRDGAAVRAAFGRRLHHPRLAWLAHERWSVTGGRVSPEMCFLQVYREHYGCLPGQRSEATPARRKVWVAGVRVVWTPTGFAPAVSAQSSADGAAQLSAETGPPPSAELTPPVVVSGADVAPTTPPALALVGAQSSAEPDGLTDAEIEQFWESLKSEDQRSTQALNDDHNPSSGGPVSGGGERPADDADRSGVSADPAPGSAGVSADTPAPTQRSGKRRPMGGRARRRELKMTNAQRVQAWVAEQVAAGVDPKTLTGPMAAEALKDVAESTARNVLAAMKKPTSGRHQE